MEELEFPIERTKPMNLLGNLWTGNVLGQILVAVLIVVAVILMRTMDFSLISILYSIFFIIPMILLIHRSMVSKSKKLMRTTCNLQFEDNVLQYISGFPNTMETKWQSVTITDENRNILLTGSETGGIHIKLSGDDKKIYRLGLWLDFDDAMNGAKMLQKWLKGDISDNTRKPEDNATTA
jgi:hypothetical protein